MKKQLACTFTAAALAGFVTTFVFAAEKPAADKADLAKADPAEIMKKIELAGTPGDSHKALEPLVGEWNADVRCWHNPGGAPTASKGTSKAEWTLGGRFLREEFSGEMMGKPFRGIGLTGFDNQKQKYVSVWTDDMSTAIMTSEGTADASGKTITFTSKMDCPVTGEKDMPVKQILRIDSRDKHTFEMHDPRRGENSKTMEITYTRKEGLAGAQ
jgi:hypothetical protein